MEAQPGTSSTRTNRTKTLGKDQQNENADEETQVEKTVTFPQRHRAYVKALPGAAEA